MPSLLQVGYLGNFTPVTLTNVSHACKLSSRANKPLFDQSTRIAIFNGHSSELWDLSDLLNLLISLIIDV